MMSEQIEFLKPLGYTVISNGPNSTLKVKCKNGHIFNRRFSDFKKGCTRCLECERQDKINFAKEHGFEIIAKHPYTKLEFKCKNGNTFKKTFGEFKKNPICTKCKSGIIKIQDLGFNILINDSKMLKLECKNGHIFTRNIIAINKGKFGCSECIKEEKIRFLKSLGYELLSKLTIHKSLRVKCRYGHIFHRFYKSFTDGVTDCPVCIRHNLK